jgi:hypothetical protein
MSASCQKQHNALQKKDGNGCQMLSTYRLGYLVLPPEWNQASKGPGPRRTIRYVLPGPNSQIACAEKSSASCSGRSSKGRNLPNLLMLRAVSGVASRNGSMKNPKWKSTPRR